MFISILLYKNITINIGYKRTAILSPIHGKDVVDGLNEIDNIFWGNKWTIYHKLLPQPVMGLVCFIMTQFGQLLVLKYQCKNISIDDSLISGKVGHSGFFLASIY